MPIAGKPGTTGGEWVGWKALVGSGFEGKIAEVARALAVGRGKVADASEVDNGLELIAAVVFGEGDFADWVGSMAVFAVQADRTIATAILTKIIPTFLLSIGLNFTIKAGYAQ